ncbi:MAG TPA: cytochrome C, partial [Anaerolineae bacterium]
MADVKQYLRFSVSQILEHWVMAISFTVLAVTGLPQKFVGTPWAETMIGLMGGIEWVRSLHHFAATMMV